MLRRKRKNGSVEAIVLPKQLGNKAVLTPLEKYQPRTLGLDFLTFLETLLIIRPNVCREKTDNLFLQLCLHTKFAAKIKCWAESMTYNSARGRSS